LKRASLFSALTGLRWSDVEKLVWSEVQHSENNGHFIRFTQKKTKGTETLPIQNRLTRFLGEKGDPSEKIFKGLKYSAWINLKLAQWCNESRYNEAHHLSLFRHTFATLQLTMEPTSTPFPKCWTSGTENHSDLCSDC